MFDKFFDPKSVAVIGASHVPGKVGYVIAQNFSEGFKGDVYFVNRKPEPIFGKDPYESLSDVPGSPELVVISVPAPFVPGVMKECVKKKVQNVIIITAGFSEMGKEGQVLEDKIKEIVKNKKMNVLGPNVVGVFDPSTNVDTVFLPKSRLKRPKEGRIAFISQSGAVASTIMDWLAEEGIGISKFISYGNAMQMNESNLLDYLAKDEKTKVIAVYMEGVKAEGRKFTETLKRVSKKKPVVILKSGKTKKGSSAAASHTGSLAGSAQIYATVFNQFGATEAYDWEALIDYVKGFSMQPLPKGDKLLVITNGGGFGVLATDESERQKLNLNPLSDVAVKKLRKVVRPNASLHNPIDLTADSDAKMYTDALRESISKYDGAVIITLFQVPTLQEEIADFVVDMQKHGKPILCCASGGEFTTKMSKKIEDKGVPVYPTPRRAVASFGALVRYARYKKSK